MKKNDAKVAIILPVFNGIEFLGIAVDSIVRQTFEDWRLYCVDDGSCDGSVEYLSQLSDPRVEVRLRGRNSGLYAVLDETVRKVREEFVVILMQDDVLKNNHLEKFIRLAHEYPEVDIFWGSEDIVDRSGELVSRGLDSNDVELIPPSPEAMCSALLRGCIWTISGSFTRARFMSRVGFRADLPHASDWNFILRGLLDTVSLYVRDSLVSIRVHQGQTTNRHAKTMRDLEDYHAVLKGVLEDFPNFVSPAVRRKAYLKQTVRALRRALRGFLQFRLVLCFRSISLVFLLVYECVVSSRSRKGGG